MTTTIAESELVRNPDGSIYHLALHPDELADTIILVGDPDRTPKVSKYFDTIELKRQHRELVSHTGTLNNKRLTVISTGMGTDNIDIVMNELDALVNIDLEARTIKPEIKSLNIVRFGTSGGLQRDIPPDSCVVASHGVGLDSLMHFYKRNPTAEETELENALRIHLKEESQYIKPYITTGSHKLFTLFKESCYEGMTATGAGFFGPQGRTLRCELTMPHLVDNLTSFNHNGFRATNFEMETAAIYGLGNLMGHHCCSINLIIVNRLAGTVSKDLSAAMEKMIQMGLEKLTKNL